MSPLLEYAFYGILTGLAALVAVFVVDAARRAVRRRAAVMRLHVAAQGAEPVSLQRARVAAMGAPDSLVGRLGAPLMALYVQAGGGVKPASLLAASAVGAVAGFLLAQRALGNLGFSAMLALLGACATPYLLLVRARERRRNAFVAQLPSAIDVIVRSLRAGHPLTVAIAMVGRDMPAPVGEEFAACAQEMTFGLDVESAVTNISGRIGVPESSVLASTVSIQQRTGGNLTEVLSRLATLLRDRAKLKAKAKALTSEGRWSGVFLSVLPFLMFVMLMLTSPNYYGDVQDHPIVAPILGATIVWMGIGIAMINRMVNFKP